MATSNSNTRTRLDQAIDAAVRDMMRREPPPGFHGRLAGRFDAAGPRRSWLMPVLASAAVAVTALAILVIGSSRGSQPAAPPAAPAPLMAGQPATADPVQARSAAPEQIAGRTTTGVRPRRPQPWSEASSAESIFGPRRSTVTAASLGANAVVPTVRQAPDWMTVPPLPPVPDIVLAPIEISRIGSNPRSGSR